MQFRRDALGAAASLPISPTSSGINGSTVIQNGKLLAVEGEGIVIEDSHPPAPSSFWIPYHVILSVETAGHK